MSPSDRYRVTLGAIERMTPTVKSYTFAFEPGIKFSFKPGQFVRLFVPKEGKLTDKPYSIASPPGQERQIELCVKRIEKGYVSTYLDQLTGGESLEMSGPIGKFHLKEPVDSDLVFLATGTGVVPFRSMLRGLFPIEPDHAPWAPYQFHADPARPLPAGQAGAGGRQVWLFLGVRHEDEILYESEFRRMAERYPAFHFIPTISRPRSWQGATGYVQEQAAKQLQASPDKQIYVCGLLPMIEGARAALKGMGFPREQIHYEIYT